MKKRRIKDYIENEVLRAEIRTQYRLDLILTSIVTRLARLESLQLARLQTVASTPTRKATEVIRDTDPNYGARQAEWFGKVEEAIVELNGMVQK